MNPVWKEWRITRASLYGILFGILANGWQQLTDAHFEHMDGISRITQMGGGAFGGAFLFALVAFARNKLTQPRR